jgi:hypothetical protein
VRWELEERKKKKTDKLRKAIGEDEKVGLTCAAALAGKGSKTGLKRYPSAWTVSSSERGCARPRRTRCLRSRQLGSSQNPF